MLEMMLSLLQSPMTFSRVFGTLLRFRQCIACPDVTIRGRALPLGFEDRLTKAGHIHNETWARDDYVTATALGSLKS
jgi:hypothetical protein